MLGFLYEYYSFGCYDKIKYLSHLGYQLYHTILSNGKKVVCGFMHFVRKTIISKNKHEFKKGIR